VGGAGGVGLRVGQDPAALPRAEAEAMGAYRRLVKDLIAAGGKAGVGPALLERLEREPPVFHLAATEPLLAVGEVRGGVVDRLGFVAEADAVR
jgi:hypothetical protein